VLPNPLRRAAMLVGTLSLLALAAPISSASALVETSQITSPTSPTYVLYDETAPSSITVSGTTTISGNIALRCYYGPKPENNALIANEVKPSGGAFSVEVEAKSLYDGPCVLRAVPVTDKEAHPPGGASEEMADPFQGPRIVGSRFEVFTENKTPYDYEVESNTLAGYFDFESVGDCGLDYSRLFAPTSLIASDYLFDCNAALYKEDDPPSGSSTRSELQIDGANAYGPATADYLASNLKVTIPGAPDVAVSKTFEPSTGLITVHEVDPIVKCSPETVFPPNSTTCKDFVSTGVQLERTWQTSDANHVAWMTDTWRSTDGAAHSLNALYDQETVNGGKGGAYEFPGAGTFSATAKEQLVTLPSGAGAIYYKEDAATPNVGDGEHPQGAIVYDTLPSGPLSVYRGTEAGGYNGFEMPYQHTIPAGGTYTLRMAFVQAYALSEVETLSNEVLASYHPTLTISSPANGATVSTPSVTVTGSASDTEGTPTLTVDGKAVSVGASGEWSTTVTLNRGANTITAVATNQLGLTTEKSASVTYTPPSPPVAHASQVGSAKGANGEVSFTISCTGSTGTSCEVESTLTTVEKTRHGRPVAVSARRHPKTRSEKVTVGSSKLTIPAGQRVTISIELNSTGKSLLAQFGRLPVHLTVVLLTAGHRSTVIAQNLTVTPHKAKHKRHHHHHHHHHH
jgi:Glucodextranase, domain B